MQVIIGYALSLAVWTLTIVVMFTKGEPWLFLIMIIIRIVELALVALSAGRHCNVPPIKNILMTFMFGPFWWAPLRQQQNGTEPHNLIKALEQLKK